MSVSNFGIKGLTEAEVLRSRDIHGENRLDYKKDGDFFDAMQSIAMEPMVLLLLGASIIYFVIGDLGDAIFLLASIVLVVSISFYQDSRSKNALEKLKSFTRPNCKVIRNGEILEIEREALVVGDYLVLEEGSAVPADGIIVHSNDFSVDESVLTGESLSVFKDTQMEDCTVYCGTTVFSGLAIIKVTGIGNASRLAKIGIRLDSIPDEKTPLELQIGNFVKKMAITGAVVFCMVWGINFFRSHDVLDSLLKALTLAMSILPEEIPVAFTTFMALGAWRLMKMGIVVKQMKTVETLGSATVICTDKTGTITENKMTLARLFVLANNKVSIFGNVVSESERELVRLAMWASEPIAFDPMEKALHETYFRVNGSDERPFYTMVHEYPLGGKPPMMTHIFEDRLGHRIVAAKGAPEAFFGISNLSDSHKQQLKDAISNMGSMGYRILGVAQALFSGSAFPKEQTEFQFEFKGLVAFYDPPKKNISRVLQDFDLAGIEVKLITGDNEATTKAIAEQIGFKGYDKSISGDELMALSDGELAKKVKNTYVFTRMFPEAKLRIIDALRLNNEIVAMTGDGINDGPALKAAHIGIAMGKKGTDIAKHAASLILAEDDLAKMVDAIAMGRRIYTNLKKAIRYIISIHIPIILIVFVPLVFGWVYPNIFTPAHVILLELIMGPTCSIIYENEPMEKNTMIQRPRPFSTSFFNGKELFTSIQQGVLITIFALSIYQYAIYQGFNEAVTRTMVFVVLIAANISLTMVNRSFYYSVLTTMRYRNNLVPLIVMLTVAITCLLLYVGPFTRFFRFESLGADQLTSSLAAGFISVIWYEGVKWAKRS